MSPLLGIGELGFVGGGGEERVIAWDGMFPWELRREPVECVEGYEADYGDGDEEEFVEEGEEPHFGGLE